MTIEKLISILENHDLDSEVNISIVGDSDKYKIDEVWNNGFISIINENEEDRNETKRNSR